MDPRHEADHDPLRPHAHEPNPAPPSADPAFRLVVPDGRSWPITVETLRAMTAVTVPGCYIVSTGHGTSGPFTFTGVGLGDLIERYVNSIWSEVAVVSADGFGCRVTAVEIEQANPTSPFLLAYAMNNRPMSRRQGLVRLVVPGEHDDALRQVKWIGEIQVT